MSPGPAFLPLRPLHPVHHIAGGVSGELVTSRDKQEHSIDPATSVSSLTWRHLVGEFSMKDKVSLCWHWRSLCSAFDAAGPMQDVWDACLKRAVTLGVELHAAGPLDRLAGPQPCLNLLLNLEFRGRISTDDLEGMEPFLFLGLPAVAVVQLVRRSADKSGLVFDEDRMIAADLQAFVRLCSVENIQSWS